MTERIGEPSAEEIEQAETPLALRTVPVKVETPVRVQQLPAAQGAHYVVTFSDAVTAVQFARRNPRRKRMVLLGVTDGIWVGTNRKSVEDEQAFRIGGSTSSSGTEITHIEELWAKPDSSAAALLCVIEEFWT